MRSRPTFPVFAPLVCAAVIAATCDVAEAQRSRAARAAQTKAAQNQAAYMQLEMMRYQTEVAKINDEIYRSFDQDGDGVLKGPEKSRFDKHMHEIQTGKAANPFAFILPVGQGPRPKSPLDELKKRADEYKSDVVAKQRELFNAFDENGNGQLEGTEKSKFDKHMRDIQTGKAPNPFATLASPSGKAGAKK